VVLKDNSTGEVTFSCSTVTDVATISSQVLSNASVILLITPQRYLPTSVSNPPPVAKNPIIGRPRFDGGLNHPSSGTPFSYFKTIPEVAEANISRG